MTMFSGVFKVNSILRVGQDKCSKSETVPDVLDSWQVCNLNWDATVAV